MFFEVVCKVPVCKECKFGVSLNYVRLHLKNTHYFDALERERIWNQGWRVDGLVEEEDELELPELPVPFPQLLPVRVDLFACEGLNDQPCPRKFICAHEVKIKEHCRKEHGWVNPQKSGQRISNGRGSNIPSRPWRSGVHGQFFWKKGSGGKYFEVATERQELVSTVEPRVSTEELFGRFQRQIREADEETEIRTRRRLDQGDEKLEVSPWKKRLGAPKHLDGLNAERLLAASKIPKEDDEDQVLYVICEGFRRCIVEAQAISTQCGTSALMEVNRKEIGLTKSSKPFDARLEVDSFKRYQRLWLQLLCYFYRTVQWEDDDRPKYRVPPRQRRALDELMQAARQLVEQRNVEDGDGGSGSEEIVARKVRQLCIAMLDHRLGDHDAESVLVSGLMVCSLKPEGGYQDADDYTPKLSAAIKLARMMVLAAAYERREVARQEMKDDGKDDETIDEQLPSHWHYVREMVNRFMVLVQGGVKGSHPTPMNWMFQLRTYGFAIRYNTTAGGVIDWIGVDRDTVLYQQVQLQMSTLREMIHGVVEEARQQLLGELMLLQLNEHGDETGETRSPFINWNWLDDASNEEVGWSFRKDRRNKFPVDGETWLMRRVIEEDRLREQFLDSNSMWRRCRVEEYGRRLSSFLEKLGFLYLNVGGGLPRIPELLSVRMINTSNGGVRNITLDRGQVRYVTAYDKTYRTTARLKIVHRFLPREVGELAIWYMWVVLPFWQNVQKLVYGRREFSPFLWREQPEERMEEEEEEEEQLNTNRIIGWDQKWDSERFKRVLKGIYYRYTGFSVGVSANRQLIIAVQRKYLQMTPEEDNVEGLDDDTAEAMDLTEARLHSYVDKSTGHVPGIAANIYARDLREAPNETERDRAHFREVSRRWHQWLGFASAGECGTKRKRANMEDDAMQAQLSRWKRMRHVNIYAVLDKLVGEGSAFRGIQEAAVRGIMSGKTRVLTVMGTGAGKSMLFMLPAKALPDGVSVVVVPLLSLRGDLQRRCRTAGVACVEWDSRFPTDGASIVLVTPEGALSKRFANFLNRIQGQGRLDRVVMDECHTVLESSVDFRPKMREVGRLMAVRGVQMVYLTATLRPDKVAEFLEVMGLGETEVYQYRAATTRKNVRYRIRLCMDDESEVEAAERVVKGLEEKYVWPGKMIVYTDTISHGADLAERLAIPLYHARAGSTDQKKRLLENFAQGQERVIVATNAMGLGVDIPDIRGVVHMGRPRRLEQYAQESGRAGRDGLGSEAIVVMKEQKGGAGGYRSARLGAIEGDDLESFLRVDGCQRVVMDRVMDGRTDRRGCEEGEEACAWCWTTVETGRGSFEDSGVLVDDLATSGDDDPVEFERQGRELEGLRRKIIEFGKEEGFELSQLRWYLDEVAGRCVVCVLDSYDGQVDMFHDWRICGRDWNMGEEEKRVNQEGVAAVVRQLDDMGYKKKVMARFSGCWFCGLPQEICYRWEKKDQGWMVQPKVGCQYGSTVFEAVLLGMQETGFAEILGQWMQEEPMADGRIVKMEDVEWVLRWLGQKVKWGGLETNYWTKVFYRMMEEKEKGLRNGYIKI